jgi:Cd2+/Zn2+-exporting ATPase
MGIAFGILGLITNIKLLVIISYILILTDIITKTIIDITENKKINIGIIVIISSIVIYFTNYLKEGLILVTLYELSKILEIILKEISNYNIDRYTNYKTDKVTIKRNDEEITINPENINKGDIIIVSVGEKIPVDGIIKDGTSTIDTSFLTGHSNIKKVTEEDLVYSGCTNLFDTIEIEALSDYDNSIATYTYETINESFKTKIKKDPYYRINLIITILIVLISITYLLVSIFLNKDLNNTIYKTISIFLLAETSANIISIPILYNIGVALSEHRGIIIKDRNLISKLFKTKEIIFSKTNLFTKDNNKEYSLTIHNKKYSKNRILDYYAKGEYSAAKPFTNVIEYYDLKPTRRGITDYKETKNTISYIYKKDKIEIELKNKNTYLLNINDKLISTLEIKEGIKEQALITIEELKKDNIKTLLITDEEESSIKTLSNNINIDTIKYELNTDQRYIELKEELIHTKGTILFISNNKEDASSLELSDIGISLNCYNNKYLSSASDISIKDEDLTKIITLLKISKKINKNIIINLIISYILKIILSILLIFNILYIPIIILVNIFISIITILNTNKLIIRKV